MVDARARRGVRGAARSTGSNVGTRGPSRSACSRSPWSRACSLLTGVARRGHRPVHDRTAVWCITLGWVVARATTDRKRIVATALASSPVLGFFGEPLRESVVVIGLLVLIWVPRSPSRACSFRLSAAGSRVAVHLPDPLAGLPAVRGASSVVRNDAVAARRRRRLVRLPPFAEGAVLGDDGLRARQGRRPRRPRLGCSRPGRARLHRRRESSTREPGREESMSSYNGTRCVITRGARRRAEPEVERQLPFWCVAIGTHVVHHRVIRADGQRGRSAPDAPCDRGPRPLLRSCRTGDHAERALRPTVRPVCGQEQHRRTEECRRLGRLRARRTPPTATGLHEAAVDRSPRCRGRTRAPRPGRA